MENFEKQELMREYAQRLRSPRYWLTSSVFGYGRFSIKNDTIVEKSLKSILYGAFIIIISNLTLIHIIYETAIVVKYLLYTELIILLELSVTINFFLLSITFGNTGGLAKLINHGIDIDMLLGRKDTMFMRVLLDRLYVLMGIPVLLMQITIVTTLYLTFKVSIAVHVTGSIYFIWMLGIFYDVNYLLTHSMFLSMRIRYLNVALMKKLDVDVEFVPGLFLFNGLVWKRKHDDLVHFHQKSNNKQFTEAFKMMFHHLKIFQDCYKFLILITIICISAGTLLSIQTVIIYGRTGMDIIRKSIIIGWLVAYWLFFFSLCFQIDIISRQIDQTKLICTFAQLNSITDERVYRFTKGILHVIESRDARFSIYDLFYLDPSTMLRLSGSVFVYVAAQLQLTTTITDARNIFINGTTTVPSTIV